MPSGFTLVELLVVITIITVLASLLMPAIRSALESARTVACVNNLRQSALALTYYADDYKMHYPPRYTLSSQNLPNLPWHGYLYSYLDIDRSPQPNAYHWAGYEHVFTCPSKEGRRFEWGAVSYGMTWFHSCAEEGSCTNKHSWKASRFGSKTVLIGDSYGDANQLFRGRYPDGRHPGNQSNLMLWDLRITTLEWLPAVMGWGTRAPKFDPTNRYEGSTATSLGDWYANVYDP